MPGHRNPGTPYGSGALKTHPLYHQPGQIPARHPPGTQKMDPLSQRKYKASNRQIARVFHLGKSTINRLLKDDMPEY